MESQDTLGAWQTFWQMSNVAFVLLVLLALAIQTVLVIAPLKWLQLRRLLKAQARFELELQQALDVQRVISLVGQHPNAPGARMLRQVLVVSGRRQMSPDDLLGVARRAIVEERTRAERLMPTLAGLAAVSPLMGLFGTVWGIIEAFLKISAERSSELPVIAPAMSGALLTTALGLLAAMPASLAYNYLDASIQRLVDSLDTVAQSWTGLISQSGLRAAASTPAPSAHYG